MQPKVILAKTSLWKRFAAFLIDLFIINSFLLIPFKKLFKAVPSPAAFSSAYNILSQSNELRTFLVKVTLFAALIAFLYFVIFETFMNQTLGRMLFNIYVIPVDLDQKNITKGGLRIGFFKAAIRNLFIFPFFPFILLWVIEPISMMFNPAQQRTLEMLTKTRTVERFIK